MASSAEASFSTEEDLPAAFPGKNIDTGADFGSEVILAEIVAGTVKVATREQADITSFREDAERLVLGKPRQPYASAANLLHDPQQAKSPLPAPARRIFPIVVSGGQFPVNPLSIRYVRELATEGLPPAAT